MRASLTKAVAGSLAALTLGVAVLGATTPASAASAPAWHGGGGGWHGGGGGWHGGGWRGGGWGWRGGWGWGPAVAFGALATGAVIASAPYYGYGYPYYGNCVSYQPTYDRWGHYLGQQPVNMCQ